MLQTPAVSSRSSSAAAATASHEAGHQRRASHLTFPDKDEGLLGALSHGPASAALNAKAVFQYASPAKKSAVVDQHILRSCQESISNTPRPQPASSTHSPPPQKPPPPPPLPAATANHPTGRFFAPSSFFSPPCTRVGLGSTSDGGSISAGSSPALRKSQFGAESNHSRHRPNPDWQRTLSNTHGASILPQPHPHQSSSGIGPSHSNAGHRAAASATSMFRPILTLIAATSTTMSTVESNIPAVVGLSPSWSNEDLPSPIYNHGSNDSLYYQGAAPPGAVFANRSASTSSESVADVATLTENRGGSDDDGGGGGGGGSRPPLEIRIQSPGLSLPSLKVTGSSFEKTHLAFDNRPEKDGQNNSVTDLDKEPHEDDHNSSDEGHQYLATTPLLDLQEQGYVVTGSVGLREFEFEEEPTTRPQLAVNTTFNHRDSLSYIQEGSKYNSDGDDNSLSAVGMRSSGGAPLSAGLDERYWLPTMSIEDFGALQQQLMETTSELPPVLEQVEYSSEPEIKQTEDQEEEKTRCDNINVEPLLFSDLLPIELKEMECQLMQEQNVDIATRKALSDDGRSIGEDDVLVIHIDFERLMLLCTEYEREKDEWRRLWARGGGLDLDLTFDDCELETVKSLQQQQVEQEEIVGNSCVIDMEVLLGCSWKQLQGQEIDQDQICDELPYLEDGLLPQEEHLEEKEKEADKEEEEKEAEVAKDLAHVADSPVFGPLPLSKRVQFDPMIQVFEIEDSFTQPVATEEDGFCCAVPAASPSPEWVAFKVFRLDQFTELPDMELSDLTPSSEVCAMSDLGALSTSETTPIQETSRRNLSIATTPDYPPLPPSPLLDSNNSQPENDSPNSASSESSNSTLTSPNETYTSDEKNILEISLPTTVVASIDTSLEANVLCPPSQSEEDDVTRSPTSPRTLELKATRMQLQCWVETAARLRDREVILTQKIDELVQDMVSILDIYQDAELGLQATELVVQELRQELVKEQEIGFASIQEAALSIQEKEVLEAALAASWSELQLLREAWSLQKALAIEEKRPSGKNVEDTEETEGQVENPTEETSFIDEPEFSAERKTLTRPLQKSVVPTFMKQASLVLLFIFATASLLVLLCGHQHQLHTAAHTVRSWISDWSTLTTNRIQLGVSKTAWFWQHSGSISDNLFEAAPVLSSMKEWKSCLRQSEQAQWVFENGCHWAEGQIQHWTLVIETLTDLWMDLTPMDVWRGYRLGLMRS